MTLNGWMVGSVLVLAVCWPAARLQAQSEGGGLSGPDMHEDSPSDRSYLLGGLRGEREKLLERGVDVDVQYIGDALWNVRSAQEERLADFSRVRGTVNLDLSKLAGAHDLSFHITAVWQGGANLAYYLGTDAYPSSLASQNTFRLDSYWIQKGWFGAKLVGRIGQFAGDDTYGAQRNGDSYIIQPLGGNFGNLNSDYESFDPPSTPAAEVRVIPMAHFYIKSMVSAAERAPYDHNPTGLVPQFRGSTMSDSEIGWTPGLKANEVRALDQIRDRRGYSGVYQLGGTYNPGKFVSTRSVVPVNGNFLVYLMGSQALWRVSRLRSKGVDLTAGADWTPADRSRQDQQITIGLRGNDLLPIPRHNSVDLGYVRTGVNSLGGSIVPPAKRRAAEYGLELNVLFRPVGWLILQPVVERYLQVGGAAGNATVVGFRSKVNL